jgi:hypothetical protein
MKVRKSIIIAFILAVLLLAVASVLGQENHQRSFPDTGKKDNITTTTTQKVINQISGLKNYSDTKNKFAFQYFGELSKPNDNEVIIKLPSETQKNQGYISVLVSSELSVNLPGTYGGRLPYNQSTANKELGRYAIEKDTVNALSFTKEYWIVYGGMGSWDAVVNTYTKHQDHYYIISLNGTFFTVPPGEVVEGKKISEEELSQLLLERMRDPNNNYFNVLNGILSSFSISD